MEEADLMENSDGCFDGTAMDGDYPENLMISLESLFKILDEEPVPATQNSSGNPDDFHGKQLDCDQRDSEAFHHQSESFPSELGTPNCFGESECKTEPWFGPPVELKGEFDNSSGIFYGEPRDDKNPCTSLQVESNGICSLPSVHSPDWLRLSSTYFDTSVMDSYGDSFGSLVTDDVKFHKLLNNSTNYSISQGSAEEFGHLYPQYTNFVGDTDLDGMKGNLVHQDSETPLRKSCTKSSADLDNNISSPCMLQMGEPGSAHFILRAKHGSINERYYDMKRGAMPDSTVQNENVHQHLECKPADLVSHQYNNITPDINATKAIYDSHDASNSCLIVRGGFLVSAEAAPKQSLPAQVRGSPHDKEAQLCGNNGAGDRLFLSEDSVMCTLQDPSLHSSLLEDSVVDLDAFLPCGLCTQQCRCGDMGMMSESSTDSSPLPSIRNPMLDGSVNKSRQLFSDLTMILHRKEQMNSLQDKRQPQLPSSQEQQYKVSKVAKIAVQSNPSRRNSTSDGDEDLFILGDVNDTVPPAPPSILVKPHPMTQRCSFIDYHSGSGTSRPKANDERISFRLALQDLSQPKSEANPPDGVLAVPLLRHQRIALSWMVHKETAGLNCSGGILADDQGLGKTISTIALILTERCPLSTNCSITEKKCEYEHLNLDDEDEVDGSSFIENSRMNQSQHSGPSVLARTLKSDGSIVIIKGRPAAGTLVVCPTSVLRQWAEELQSKITSKANLSFLIYHGSNRTKDPNELAKFDVVLTTYAIVSMEVPKQPLVDKDDTDRGKPDGCSMLAENSDYKKRKEHPSASSINKKQKNVGSSLLESAAPRPLAKVGWFRVILDEAQSIKNHRTQVARACWGLRAKRRWCLSGTPIQNAIDDLYSYFRFLRYDPYAVYKSFCSAIKIPISRNPPNGYKKLQAVLKTIMLRRTKGSLIDGKPIITLPSKTITLKRVDFSKEERNFYLALEAESREQFKVYEDAGTVKQNYVNILLMLLRLRQACDHPLLVKGFDSNSIWKSSFETAKMLPKDMHMKLLRCLEAGLAICTICNDAPEDAVVSICGHVFCNQCICEHLTGDDNICPQVNCRDKLNGTSVFSMDTLRRCLSEKPDLGFLSDNSISDLEHGPKICQESLCSGSSKIRAALEILHSLPISRCSASLCESAEPLKKPSVLLENTVNTISLGCSSDITTDQKSDLQTSNVKLTDKAIVFSQWTRMLDLLEVSLKDSYVLYRRLDGTMSVAARERAIKDFNTLPEVTVMIMSLKAASLGLNMVAACHVILLDLWWNPTTEDQAIDRAHRIGQTRPVTVSRLTVKDTVEDRILALQGKKREMVASAFGEDESGSRQTRLTVEDLRYLFMV